MRKVFYIFIFLLFVIPTSSVSACEAHSKKADTDQSSCNHNNQSSDKKPCCDSNDEQDNGCDGSCTNSDCHCPSSINIPIPVNHLVINMIPNFVGTTIDWTYVQNAPKPVYISIWHPPKIS